MRFMVGRSNIPEEYGHVPQPKSRSRRRERHTKLSKGISLSSRADIRRRVDAVRRDFPRSMRCAHLLHPRIVDPIRKVPLHKYATASISSDLACGRNSTIIGDPQNLVVREGLEPSTSAL